MATYLVANALVIADTDQYRADGVLLEEQVAVPTGPTFLFSPPVRDVMARVSYPIDRNNERFWNRFRRQLVGVNVYKLTTGEYTETQPDDAQIAHIYFGGHIEEVTEAEAANLEAAGYVVERIGESVTPPDETIDAWTDLAGRTWLSLVGSEWVDL